MEKALEKTLRVAVVILFGAFLSGFLQAEPTLSFVNITGNNAVDAGIGESQLSVELFDVGTGVQFVFENSGPEASSITDIYFDDGTTSIFNSVIASIDNSITSGVSFSPLASPGDLPGGNGDPWFFSTTPELSLDSDPAAQPNGVNPGESVGVTLSYLTGLGFGDVLNELNSGDLRIGIHVQGFDGGGSESFISVVPAPSAFLLATLGIGYVKLLSRKKGSLLG